MSQSTDSGEPGVELDAITALEYNINGDFLATGDRSGRITVLKIDDDDRKKTESNQENWSPYFQYQSHDPEFDFLKSLEIESKINQIKFCHPVGANNFLLSTNDKTIKLWKIGRKRKCYNPKAASSFSSTGRLELPQLDEESVALSSSGISSLQAYTRKTYSNAHTYHINSLALNSDGESFVSADDLRINWWNLNNSETCFNIIDIKPENMEELTEVITAVQFHPQHCHILAYSSSRGAIKVCDTRNSALCTTYAKVYSEPVTSTTNKSFISDILNSISDVNYSSDGRYLVSRDYLTVKIWDVNMESKPVKTIVLHDYLRPMLYDLYTSDIIFDKFEVCCSPDGKSIATGSYSNQLKISHQDQRGLKSIDLPRPTASADGTSSSAAGTSAATMNANDHGVGETAKSLSAMKVGGKMSQQQQQEEVRLDEKVLHCAWHPQNNTVAVAGKAGLCLYKV